MCVCVCVCVRACVFLRFWSGWLGWSLLLLGFLLGLSTDGKIGASFVGSVDWTLGRLSVSTVFG